MAPVGDPVEGAEGGGLSAWPEENNRPFPANPGKGAGPGGKPRAGAGGDWLSRSCL